MELIESDTKDEHKLNREPHKRESANSQTGYHDLMRWMLGGFLSISSSKNRKVLKDQGTWIGPWGFLNHNK